MIVLHDKEILLKEKLLCAGPSTGAGLSPVMGGVR